jgi:ABC-type sugar transport system ATPase subunit
MDMLLREHVRFEVSMAAALVSAVLQVSGIEKRFGGVVALNGASLSIAAGKVTALVGDNGAGKSSLVRVISGVFSPDSGTIHVGGQPVVIPNPRAARALGIHTVFQDLALVGCLDVVQNVFLGDEVYGRLGGIRMPWLNRRHMEQATREALDRLHVSTLQDILQPVEVLSGGQRQTIAIARSVRQDARLLILDEPTAALGVKQSRQVFEAVARIRASGTAVLLISHNLREVFAASDYIAVMRLGRVSRVFETASANEEEVVSAIVGANRRSEGEMSGSGVERSVEGG